MSIRARKYNVELHEYEDILLPDECRTYEEDMEKMVPCAECYDDETDRFLKEHAPFKEE